MVPKISGQRLLMVVLALLVLLLLIFQVYQLSRRENTAYINMKEVFNNFEYKKEMEVKLNKTTALRKTVLDSLKIQIEMLSVKSWQNEKEKEILAGRLNGLKQQYEYKQGQFEEENGALIDKYNQEIWDQLNQYIKDYGQGHQYTYIFGTNGDGNLMYAKENKDITKDVLNFVNNKYQGNAKGK